MNKKRKWLRWTPIYSILLAAYVGYTLLDAFVIPHDTVSISELETQGESKADKGNGEYDGSTSDKGKRGSGRHKRPGGRGGSEVHAEGRTKNSGDGDSEKKSETDIDKSSTETGTDSYSADGVTVTLTTEYINDTYVYVADVVIDDAGSLKSGLANDTFGRNVTEKTSEMAERLGAVLAINGDYYGFRDDGYVIRNGYLYRDEAGEEGQQDLVIYEDGTFAIIDESEVSAQELLDKGAVQVYSFGPVLVNDGKVTVSEGDEVDQSMNSNPRTAIGMVEKGHYVFVVSDGRTSESEGLSLSELAQVMKDAGCTVAYNLDGGGSTTMYFNGEVVNNPTTNGKKISERSVSDIVYIGK